MGSSQLVATLATTTTLLLLILSTAVSAQPPAAPSFKCTTKYTCKALIGYTPSNTTTLSHIQSLFQVKTLRSLLGVNNLPLSTPSNYVVTSNHTVKVPFPCRCSNGTGMSNRVPVYKVVKDDGLFTIASSVFGGLVTYPQIQAVNHIKDANLIDVGQKLWIPLPCSCDDVAGAKVVHYGHVVAGGSSLEGIASDFGTTPETLMSLNGISNPKSLKAGQVLDVPIKACSSNINSSSPDYNMLVANNTYVFTAKNCIVCKCEPANNFTLQCSPSGLKPVGWPTCPAAQCSNGLSLGNFTTSSSSCSQSTCAYSGYTNKSILASLVEDNTCSAPNADDNGAVRMGSTGWSLAVLLFIQLVLVYRFL